MQRENGGFSVCNAPLSPFQSDSAHSAVGRCLMKQAGGSSKESLERRGDRVSVVRVGGGSCLQCPPPPYNSDRHLELGFVRGWTFQIKECFQISHRTFGGRGTDAIWKYFPFKRGILFSCLLACLLPWKLGWGFVFNFFFIRVYTCVYVRTGECFWKPESIRSPGGGVAG